MATVEECFSCAIETKYTCLNCEKFVCVRCGYFEDDENTPGWKEGRCVGRCFSCFRKKAFLISRSSASSNTSSSKNASSQPPPRLNSECEEATSTRSNKIERRTDDELVNPCDMSGDDDSDFEECDILQPKKKKSGRKSSWMPEDIDDLVDIIINNPYYQRKLIFTNTKCQRNAEIYEEILKELKLRALNRESELKFTAKQLRTKFKKCVSDCKHAALTMKSASGIKRFQENRGLGAWFNALLPLVKSRDSCQPDQAIEPESIKQPIDTEELIESEASGDQEKLNDSKRKVEKKVFIPIKKSRNDTKKKIETAVLESVELLKEVANSDTSKEMINFLREEMDKSREHELKLIQMLNFTGSASHQQQHAFQSVPSQVTSTQYIEKGSIANYSQSPWHGAWVPNMSSQPDFPVASFDSFTQSSASMPFSKHSSPQNISDGKVYHKL